MRKNKYLVLGVKNDIQDLDAGIEQPSDASYMTGSPQTTPSAVAHGQAFPMASSPRTPSTAPRGTHEIEALSDLVDAMAHSRSDIVLDGNMNLAENENEDLDADIEDLDYEGLESSIIEGDSMEL